MGTTGSSTATAPWVVLIALTIAAQAQADPGLSLERKLNLDRELSPHQETPASEAAIADPARQCWSFALAGYPENLRPGCKQPKSTTNLPSAAPGAPPDKAGSAPALSLQHRLDPLDVQESSGVLPLLHNRQFEVLRLNQDTGGYMFLGLNRDGILGLHVRQRERPPL